VTETSEKWMGQIKITSEKASGDTAGGGGSVQGCPTSICSVIHELHPVWHGSFYCITL